MDIKQIKNWIKDNKTWFWGGCCTLVSGLLQFFAKLYPEKIIQNMQGLITTFLWFAIIVFSLITVINFIKLKINQVNAKVDLANAKITELNTKLDSSNKLLEMTMKQSSMTTKLLQYNIIFYLRNKDSDFMQYFSEKMYNMNINFDQLKEYGFDRLFSDHYKAFVHSKELDAVLNNNNIVKEDFLKSNKD